MREGWTYKKLGEVATLRNGFAFQSSLFRETGLPIVRISNIQNDEITTDFVYFDKNDYKENLNKYEVNYGDILIAMSGATTGKVGINNNKEVLYLNQRVGKFVPNENLKSRYLFYYLKQNANISLSVAQGLAQPNLSTQQINNFVLPIPSLPEQERIVSELDLLSGIIEKKNEQLKEYDKLAQSIFYDMFGDPITNEKGWEVKKLGEVATLINGFAFQSALFQKTGFPIVRISNIQDDKITSDFVYFNRDDYKIDFEKYEVLFGDILIAMSGATTGKVGINYNDVVLYLNQRVGKIVPRENVIHRYLFYYLKTNATKSLSIAQGVAQPNLSTQQINSFVLPLPPLSLQQSFAEKVEAIEKQKALVQQSISETQTLFDSTMDKYFG